MSGAAVKGRRPFGFAITVAGDDGVYVDWRGDMALTFKWGRGWFLTTNHFVLYSNAEEDRLEQMWTETGREVGHRQAKEASAARA